MALRPQRTQHQSIIHFYANEMTIWLYLPNEGSRIPEWSRVKGEYLAGRHPVSIMIYCIYILD